MKSVRMLCALLLSLLVLCSGRVVAQTSSVPASSVTAPASSVAELFRPSMLSLETVSGKLEVDKWKMQKANREQVVSYLSSMQRDIQETLPGLINTADADSDKVENLLAVSQNTGALYDVLVRVAAASEIASPEHADPLNQVAIQLRDARRRLDDAILKKVTAHQQQLADLQGQLNKANKDLAAATSTTAVKKSAKKKKKVTQ